MPLWNLHCNENAYSTEDKKSFSEAITSIYTSVGLPRFYVSVVFHGYLRIPCSSEALRGTTSCASRSTTSPEALCLKIGRRCSNS